jgi:hypothetical protein
MKFILYRNYFDEGVNGTLFCNGKYICNTIELPWKNNKTGISCIPEGKYDLKLRHSEHLGEHLHLSKVPDRKWILIHTANDAKKELRGCIAPVSKLNGKGKGSNSKRAMDILIRTVKSLARKNEHNILIIKKGNYEISRST